MTKIKYFIIPFIALTLIVGCATKNPTAGQPVLDPVTGQPTGQVQPPFIPNATGTKIVGYANQAAPLIPSPWGTILTGVGAIATLVMGGIAKQQSGKASDATDKATAAQATTTQIAKSVAAQGDSVAQAVINHASSSGVAPAVFAAINNHLPEDPIAPNKT